MEEEKERGSSGPHISLAKLTSLNLDSKISIFYRPERYAGMQLLDDKFPKEAAMTFCERIRREMLGTSAKSFIITAGNMTAVKDLLEWIKECAIAQKVIHFKSLVASEKEEPSSNSFTYYSQIIAAAQYLEIPARDLTSILHRRLLTIARKTLMSWSEVELYYDSDNELGLRDVAAASIFQAWWDARLDEDDTPKEMEKLSDLRMKILVLDEDLKELYKLKVEEVEKRRAEKRAKKQAEANARVLAGEVGGQRRQGSQHGHKTTATMISGSDALDRFTQAVQSFHGTGKKADNGTEVVAASTGWEKENSSVPAPSKNGRDVDYSGPNGGVRSDTGAEVSAGNEDWADEVNDHQMQLQGASTW